MSSLDRFVILREAGGMGDVVRTFPVARGLKETHPGARVDYVCLAGYEGLVSLSPDVDRVFAVTERERRPRDAEPDPSRFPYLRRVLNDTYTTETRRHGELPRRTTSTLGHVRPGEASRRPPCVLCASVPPAERSAAGGVRVPILVDLYCPAYRHERETEGAVTLDRVEIFARAAGVPASTPRLEVPRQALDEARAKLRIFFRRPHGSATEVTESTETGRHDKRQARAEPLPSVVSVPSVAGRSVIGLAPYATHVTRSLPEKDQVVALARSLRSAGARLVFFHSWKCARPGREEVRPAEIGAYPALRLPWALLGSTVAACDLVISVDTGILHLAGALGVPTLGLFGPTSGEVITRPYPTHSWMTSPEQSVGCRPPCYGRAARGYSKDVCGRVGCEVMRALRPDGV